MPITLGCPSCMKRFRARDESAGKKVKCPYCGAAVAVPTAEEAAAASSPTDALPQPPGPAKPSKPALDDSGTPPVPKSRPGPAPVATPDDWGAADPPPRPTPQRFEDPPAPVPPPLDFPRPGVKPTPTKRAVGGTASPAAGPKTPEQLAAPNWRRTKAGLGWVLFGLFLLALPGFVGFAKAVYPRATGKDAKAFEIEMNEDGWVSIPGAVNSPEPGAVKMSKMNQIDVAAYALPVILGGLVIAFGRLTCGAAPRSSGAKGLFACSGLFSLVALAALVTAAVTQLLLFKETFAYASVGFLLLAGVAEFWFLNGLTASGVALKRPKAARAVGAVGFVFFLVAAAATLGWKVYYEQFRPKPPNEDWLLYEQAGVMIGWLLMIGVYWRAVSHVRGAIREFLDAADQS